MKVFNFRKLIKRTNFTTVFGNVGGRRRLRFKPMRKRNPGLGWRYWHLGLSGRKRRHKMRMYRRGAQGWMNQTYGRLQALRLRLQYGRKNPVRRFIK